MLKALFNKLQKASSKNGFEVEYDSRTGNILISFDKNTIRVYYENNKFYTKENDDVEEYDSIKELEEALNDVWDIDLTATGSTTLKPYSYKGKTVMASSKQEAIKKIVSANKHPLHEKAVKLCSMLGKKDGSRKFKAYIDYDGPNDEHIMVKTSKFYNTLGSIEITLYPENSKIGIYCETFDIEVSSMPEKDFSVKTEKEAVAYVLKVYNTFDKFYETIKDASKKLSDAIKNK